jgi:hypothetical protein
MSSTRVVVPAGASAMSSCGDVFTPLHECFVGIGSPSSNAGDVTFIVVVSDPDVVVGDGASVDAAVESVSSVDDEQAAVTSASTITAVK